MKTTFKLIKLLSLPFLMLITSFTIAMVPRLKQEQIERQRDRQKLEEALILACTQNNEIEIHRIMAAIAALSSTSDAIASLRNTTASLSSNKKVTPTTTIIKPTVKPQDECVVCFENAEAIDKAQGSQAILQTGCCKQFICGKCLAGIKKHNIQECPSCIRTAEFKTKQAIIEKPVIAKVSLENGEPAGNKQLDSLIKEKQGLQERLNQEIQLRIKQEHAIEQLKKAIQHQEAQREIAENQQKEAQKRAIEIQQKIAEERSAAIIAEHNYQARALTQELNAAQKTINQLRIEQDQLRRAAAEANARAESAQKKTQTIQQDMEIRLAEAQKKETALIKTSQETEKALQEQLAKAQQKLAEKDRQLEQTKITIRNTQKHLENSREYTQLSEKICRAKLDEMELRLQEVKRLREATEAARTSNKTNRIITKEETSNQVSLLPTIPASFPPSSIPESRNRSRDANDSILSPDLNKRIKNLSSEKQIALSNVLENLLDANVSAEDFSHIVFEELNQAETSSTKSTSDANEKMASTTLPISGMKAIEEFETRKAFFGASAIVEPCEILNKNDEEFFIKFLLDYLDKGDSFIALQSKEELEMARLLCKKVLQDGAILNYVEKAFLKQVQHYLSTPNSKRKGSFFEIFHKGGLWLYDLVTRLNNRLQETMIN